MIRYTTCPKCGIEGSVTYQGQGVSSCSDCGSAWRDPGASKVTAKLKPQLPRTAKG